MEVVQVVLHQQNVQHEVIVQHEYVVLQDVDVENIVVREQQHQVAVVI